MTNLKEEIRKSSYYICEDKDCVGCNEELDKLLAIFRQTMLEIIGEDEDYYGELSMWDKAQNSLRAEMRERVEKILDQDS